MAFGKFPLTTDVFDMQLAARSDQALIDRIELRMTGLDKSRWPRGPWDNEPDQDQWVHRGIYCVLLRHESDGYWLGYIGLEYPHPWHGADIDRVPVAVHGGPTWARSVIWGRERIVVPAGLWWIGFDCGHATDLPPATWNTSRPIPVDDYRTYAFAHQEAEAMADQAADLAWSKR